MTMDTKKTLLLLGLFAVCLFAFTAGAAFALTSSDQCLVGHQLTFSAADSDGIFNRIIKFLYSIIQAMISLFCKIIAFAGFRCG